MQVVRQTVVDDLDVGCVDELLERSAGPSQSVALGELGNPLGIAPEQRRLDGQSTIAQARQCRDVGLAEAARAEHSYGQFGLQAFSMVPPRVGACRAKACSSLSSIG